MPMLHCNDDLLLAIAMGDAYGAGFEYVDRKKHPEIWAQHTLEGYVRHPTHGCRGTYTDDTQMSIAVAEVLIGKLLNTRAFADAFVRCFQRDPRDGYARGFQSFLEQFLPLGDPRRRRAASARTLHHGRDFLAHISPRSTKNGAMMRAVPIGALPAVADVLAVARTQAALTHDTIDGICSAQAVALMGHFALWGAAPLSELSTLLDEHIGGSLRQLRVRLDERWSRPVQEYQEERCSVAVATLHAVVDVLTHSASLREVLERSVAFGGDTDSVAAVALGIASCRFHDPLPAFLERDLECDDGVTDASVTSRTPKPYGVPFLRQLGKQLMDAYDR